MSKRESLTARPRVGEARGRGSDNRAAAVWITFHNISGKRLAKPTRAQQGRHHPFTRTLSG